MSDRSMPEDWSVSQPPAKGDNGNQPHTQHSVDSASQYPTDRELSQYLSQQRHNSEVMPQSPSHSSQSGSVSPSSATDGKLWSSVPPSGEPPSVGRKRWWKHWMLWAALAALGANGVAIVAMTMLFKLPSAPNCPAIFWPLASGTVRLHCAQVAAAKRTVPDLMAAIALVKPLPQNHPLSQEIERGLAEWSQDLLALAEEKFQAGQLSEAIAIASDIPSDVSTASTVPTQIEKWKSIWAEAEKIYAEAESQIPKENWYRASMAAVRLLNVGNNYWANTKYEELKYAIATAREDGGRLEKIQNLVNRGRADDFLAAIQQIQAIEAGSYFYQKAQAMIPDIGRKMLDLAQETLDKRDVDKAVEIANQIPAVAKLETEVQDFTVLAEAHRSAFVGTVSSIEAAIAEAQKIGLDRPLYYKAQDTIARWQLEIEDVQHLAKARSLAQPGAVADLNAAIAEALMIPDSNPRAAEAKREIDGWRRRIQTFEDQPYLNRADEIVVEGDVVALQAAVDEASKIGEGRALYGEARKRIRNWTRQIQTIEDQPFLDQARDLANNGNLPAAIAAAGQIGAGRALHATAQAEVKEWQTQLQAEQDWREAQQVALQNTPDALAQAIRLADRVPNSNSLRLDVNPAINNWGDRLLRLAQDQGTYNPQAGIDIARKIPRSSSAYGAAQAQIGEWQRILNPPPPEPLPSLDNTAPSPINSEPIPSASPDDN
ncbi:chromosome segregation ATPase [Chroococcidiopsis sp. CCALA 051]|uniref:chromosome segregation ATPase n=1 Tax=Chroococcidiopsis sp. CCALA 051 TaxID=869949 RepID=UPI001E521263|nr:chromosome segregation ATPase [Chroococcidiopsis sp. CCALA 051]